MTAIKPTYIVTDMNLVVSFDNTGEATEFRSEKAAIKAATTELAHTTDNEVWVWKLCMVVSKPDLDPVVDRVGKG